MRRQKITSFIFDDGDYFSAHLENGGIRVGMIGGVLYDIGPDHSHFYRASKVANSEEAETLHDDLFSAFRPRT